MTSDQQILWEKIKDFELDDPDAVFPFSERLAKENGWSLAYSLRAIEEYKKFIFLICSAFHPLTPSDAVDQVWHLHLIYTESYWTEFCGNVLGKSIHHNPTRGGMEEQNRYAGWYDRTLAYYEKMFIEKPPADIWPENGEGFKEKKYWLIKRSRFFK